MPLNDAIDILRKSKIIKRIVFSNFDGLSDSYVFKVRAELLNGWVLDYWEHKTPKIRRYSFHVFKNSQMIVRWDNTPHYPKLEGFPHHKHEGKRVVSSDVMTITEVLKQLEQLSALTKT